MENVMSKEIMRKWEVVLNNKSIIRSLATEQGSSLAKGVSNSNETNWYFMTLNWIVSHITRFIYGTLGETINQIKEKSGAFVQINKNPPQEHPDWKYFTIRGNQNQIAHAQKLIQVSSIQNTPPKSNLLPRKK